MRGSPYIGGLPRLPTRPDGPADVFGLRPIDFIVGVVAAWLNRHQQDAIEYLREENRVLREMLGHRRLRFTDDHRRRLAIRGACGAALGRGGAVQALGDERPANSDTLAGPKAAATGRPR